MYTVQTLAFHFIMKDKRSYDVVVPINKFPYEYNLAVMSNNQPDTVLGLYCHC